MYSQIIEFLHQEKGNTRKIASDTGLDYDWLHKVKHGVIDNPGIKKMEILADYMERSCRVDDSATKSSS